MTAAANPPRLPDIDVDALLDRHRDRFRHLLQVILTEESGEDPFSFPLARFQALSDDEKAELVRRADRIARDRVDHELEARKAAWLVLVGNEVVLASGDPQAIPTAEDVLLLGAPKGLVAYLFEAPLIEEVPGPVSSWTALGGHDRYPTIRLTIEGTTIVADLDTGSHGTLLDADLAPVSGGTWFSGKHLGSSFLWSPARVDVEIVSGNGKTVQRALAVRRVRDWKASPFVRINPQRTALVGRDLLRAFSLSLILRSSEAETEISTAE
jgi:hypothetical protein